MTPQLNSLRIAVVLLDSVEHDAGFLESRERRSVGLVSERGEPLSTIERRRNDDLIEAKGSDGVSRTRKTREAAKYDSSSIHDSFATFRLGFRLIESNTIPLM